METELESLVRRYRELGIDKQLDYSRFYLYSIITHSTAIEGSTITELENQIMFDNGISLTGKTIEEQMMNLDLKAAYEKVPALAKGGVVFSIDLLKELSALVMKNTGKEYRTALGDFSSAKGELRLLNVTAGIGGKSYMSYDKVPSRLAEFCKDLNKSMSTAASLTLPQLYDLSSDAHYRLVTIHPWADGNGRMARLVMNMIQFELGLIPSIVFKEDKEDYIKALVLTRENDDLSIFRNFMRKEMVFNLSRSINAFLQSTQDDMPKGREKTEKGGEKKLNSREKILLLLQDNPEMSASALADKIGITRKGVEKQLARLKAAGIIRRVGPDKGGRWEVLKDPAD